MNQNQKDVQQRDGLGLAIFGNPPAFSSPLHVGRPNRGDKATMLRRIEEAYDRNWLTNNGPLVQEFEQRVAEIAGVKHCIALCNGTVALEIAIRACGMTGEVIVPSFTFVATAHALKWQEIEPVFCDIDPATHLIDPDCVESLITPRTTGVIGVHLWGQACDDERLSDICRRHELKLMYDAAHAFGSTYHGRPIGGAGVCEVFSFHATKFVNAAEGGAIVTNDDDFAEKTRLMRNFGFKGYDNVLHVGTNGKMSEVCAAVGLTSLESMPAIVETNKRNYDAYADSLIGIDGLSLLKYASDERHNHQYVVVMVDEARTGLTRDQIVQFLHSENVLARKYFYPGAHRSEPYRGQAEQNAARLPHTEAVAANVLLLPTGTSIDVSTIQKIADLLSTALANVDAVRERLGELK